MAIEAKSLHQTWVIFGPSGGGKTSLSATSPKPIILDSNQGTLSIAGRVGLDHVSRMDVTNFIDLDKAYERFTGQSKVNWAKKFDTIVFDHFDDIQNIVLDELVERKLDRDSRQDPDVIDQREWGIMGNRLRRYVRKFKTVGVNKILICGEKEDRETGLVKPALQGALFHQLPYLVDHIAYLRINEKGKRFLHLDPGDTWYAKTRAHWLTKEQRKIPIALDDITALTKLFELIAAGPKGTSTKRGKKTGDK